MAGTSLKMASLLKGIQGAGSARAISFSQALSGEKRHSFSKKMNISEFLMKFATRRDTAEKILPKLLEGDLNSGRFYHQIDSLKNCKGLNQWKYRYFLLQFPVWGTKIISKVLTVPDLFIKSCVRPAQLSIGLKVCQD